MPNNVDVKVTLTSRCHSRTNWSAYDAGYSAGDRVSLTKSQQVRGGDTLALGGGK